MNRSTSSSEVKPKTTTRDIWFLIAVGVRHVVSCVACVRLARAFIHIYSYEAIIIPTKSKGVKLPL